MSDDLRGDRRFTQGSALPTAFVLRLQRTIGNRQVQRALGVGSARRTKAPPPAPVSIVDDSSGRSRARRAAVVAAAFVAVSASLYWLQLHG